MNSYPFLIRGPTSVRRVHAQGRNFFNALEKVLAIFPAKFVNFKYARNMDMNTTKQLVVKLSKKNKGVEHTIWLNEKEGEFYITYLKDKFTMLVEEETDPVGIEIGSARTNKWTFESAYINGEVVPPSHAPKVENVKGEKISAKGPKSKIVKTVTMAAAENANMKTSKKNGKAAAKKPVTKVKGEKTIPRGNNMFLTEADWKKVDAILVKEDVSFSAWSRGLVQKRIGA